MHIDLERLIMINMKLLEWALRIPHCNYCENPSHKAKQDQVICGL